MQKLAALEARVGPRALGGGAGVTAPLENPPDPQVERRPRRARVPANRCVLASWFLVSSENLLLKSAPPSRVNVWPPCFVQRSPSQSHSNLDIPSIEFYVWPRPPAVSADRTISRPSTRKDQGGRGDI